MGTSTKSSHEWTEGDFVSYNIHVVDTSESQFFNEIDLSSIPIEGVPDAVLDNEEKPQGELMTEARLFYDYMELVGTSGDEWTPARVNDFTAFVLQILDFDQPDRVICQNVGVSFPTGRNAQTEVNIDVCVMDKNDVLLIIHSCSSTFVSDNPEPRMVARAIAAFHESNQRRRQNGKPSWVGRYVAAIIMYGTAPVFYRVPVTQSFLDALASNQYPTEQMVVHRFIPAVPNRDTYKKRGMRRLENREFVFECLEGLKKVLI